MHLKRLLPLLLFLLPGLAWAENAWLVRAIDAQRWPDGPTVSMSLEAGEQVTILYRDAGMVRVRKEVHYGWVPEDALTSEAPMEPEDEEAPADPEGEAPAAPAEAP